MSTQVPHQDDDELRRLLTGAVDDVEPADRLTEIRAAADARVVPLRRRRWAYAAGAAAAAAVVVGGVVVATHPGDDGRRTAPGPATQGTTSPLPSPSPTGVPAGEKAYPVYYLGPGPKGTPVLFRELHVGPDWPAADAKHPGQDRLTEAVGDALGAIPDDPDYHTPWRGHATLDYATYQRTDTGRILAINLHGHDLTRRPAGMSADEARLAVQQLIYTAQAAVHSSTPVWLLVDDEVPATLLGVPVTQDNRPAPALKTLSLVSISSPAEGTPVSGSLRVSGLNNAFEGTVQVWLERDGHRYQVKAGIGGYGGNRLYPWHVTLDLSHVPPGEYTLVARNDDPVGGAPVEQDTRTVEVK